VKLGEDWHEKKRSSEKYRIASALRRQMLLRIAASDFTKMLRCNGAADPVVLRSGNIADVNQTMQELRQVQHDVNLM
jgi:hypothetical protein